MYLLNLVAVIAKSSQGPNEVTMPPNSPYLTHIRWHLVDDLLKGHCFEGGAEPHAGIQRRVVPGLAPLLVLHHGEDLRNVALQNT